MPVAEIHFLRWGDKASKISDKTFKFPTNIPPPFALKKTVFSPLLGQNFRNSPPPATPPRPTKISATRSALQFQIRSFRFTFRFKYENRSGVWRIKCRNDQVSDSHVRHLSIESLSSTSDTNTDTNNMSCACSLLARSTRTSVLEVTTTEVGLVLEVGGIV